MSLENLAILETDWYKTRTVSVRSFFDNIEKVYFDGHNEYLYERFVGEKSFIDAVQFALITKKKKWVYVASHGHSERICCPNGDDISRTKILNSLSQTGATNLGLHLGACEFGNNHNLEHLISSAKSNLRWVAGYEESVDWYHSTILDGEFWRLMGKFDGRDENRVFEVYEELNDRFGTLIEELKFHLFALRRNKWQPIC